MASFRFRLSTLLRMRENLRNECRQHLVEAERAEDIILVRIAELNDELAVLRRHCDTVSRPGAINVDRLLDAGRYEMILKTERQAADEQRQTVAAEVDRRRQSLLEADREVKVLEKLREQQLARHNTDQAKREIKQLDAVAIQLAIGKEAG
jgi:flagellar FliJ protein